MKNKLKYLIGLIIFFIIIKVILDINTVTTPQIKGKIIDSSTEKGIENALIKVSWLSTAKYLMGLPQTIKTLTFVTNNAGEYTIPSYEGIFVFDNLSSVMIDVFHPLYVDINKNDLLSKNVKNNQIFLLQLPSDEIIRNIELTGIWEEYREAENFEDFLNKIELYKNGLYWKTLKRNNVNYNINEVFSRWNEVAKEIDSKLVINETSPLEIKLFQETAKSVEKIIIKNINE